MVINRKIYKVDFINIFMINFRKSFGVLVFLSALGSCDKIEENFKEQDRIKIFANLQIRSFNT